MSPRERTDLNDRLRIAKGLGIVPEEVAVYPARAISTVPPEQRAALDADYNAFLGILETAGWKVLAPVELRPGMDPNEVNPRNDDFIARSIVVTPFMLGVSDGRSYEHGVAYGLKGLFPMVHRDQKINIPTLRRPFQVPIFYDNLTGSDGEKLVELFRGLRDYSFGTGRCSSHGETLLGFPARGADCMRCYAEERGLRIVPVEIEPTS